MMEVIHINLNSLCQFYLFPGGNRGRDEREIELIEEHLRKNEDKKKYEIDGPNYSRKDHSQQPLGNDTRITATLGNF